MTSFDPGLSDHDIIPGFKQILVYDRKITENNIASSSSSGTIWEKCGSTFATELGSYV